MTEENPSFEAEPTRLGNDALFDVLSDQYRRYFLYYLLDSDAVSGGELRRATADWAAVADEGTTADRLSVRFYHVDVPLMVQAGLVRYDPLDDVFSLGDVSPGVRAILRRSREREYLPDSASDGES